MRREVPIITIFLLFLLGLLWSPGASALIKHPMDREKCEQYLAEKEKPQKPNQRRMAAHAGFVYHNKIGVNSRRFQEFSCGMKTATISLTDFLGFVLILGGVGFGIAYAIRRRKTLISKQFSAGSFSVDWDGTNDFGKHVRSGVYVYRIKTEQFIDSKRMILMK